MVSSFLSSSSPVKSNTGGSILVSSVFLSSSLVESDTGVVSSGLWGASSSTGWLLEKKSNTAGLCAAAVSGSWDFSGGRAAFSSDEPLSHTSPESINILSPVSLIFSGI